MVAGAGRGWGGADVWQLAGGSGRGTGGPLGSVDGVDRAGLQCYSQYNDGDLNSVAAVSFSQLAWRSRGDGAEFTKHTQ